MNSTTILRKNDINVRGEFEMTEHEKLLAGKEYDYRD